MNAKKDLTPNAEHGNFVRHIWANWKKKGFKGEKFKSLFLGFSAVLKSVVVEAKALKNESNGAYEDLMNWGSKSFYGAYIQTWLMQV